MDEKQRESAGYHEDKAQASGDAQARIQRKGVLPLHLSVYNGVPIYQGTHPMCKLSVRRCIKCTLLEYKRRHDSRIIRQVSRHATRLS
jgi:hypothetical protein